MFEKITKTLLISILILLAACQSQNPGAAGQTTIVFAYPSYLTAFNKANYQNLASEFERQNPGVTVQVREISMEELTNAKYDYFSLIRDLGIDVFLGRNFPFQAQSEYILSLDPLIDAMPEFEPDDFFPVGLEMLRQDGALKGVPAELDVPVFYYNKDLFDQAGVPYPAVDWTRDDFLRTSLALRGGLPDKVMAFGGQVDELVGFIYANGGHLRDESGYTLLDPAVVDMVRWYADLALAQKVMPLPGQLLGYQPGDTEGVISSSMVTTGEGEVPAAELTWGQAGAMAEMAAQEGDVALWVSDLSIRQGTGGWDWDFEWGILPWPSDKVNIVIPSVYAYHLTASTDHPEAALQWVDFLTRQPPQLKGIPARRSVAESERRTFEKEIGAQAYGALLESLQSAAPVDRSLYNTAEKTIGGALLEILENGQDVETALTKAQAE